MPAVFLSHSWKDKFFARKLADSLKKYGVDVWIDDAELGIGDSLIERISQALETVDFVAVILSRNSVQSRWVQKELFLAITEEIAGRRIKVLPILLEPCDIPLFLKDRIYADFTDPSAFDRSLAQLLQILCPAMTVCESSLKMPEWVPSEGTPHVSHLEDFEDIRIVGIAKDKTYRPDPDKLLFHVYLEISSAPPEKWIQIFEAERRFPRHSRWRRAWIEGNYIIIHCVPDEVPRYHLKDLHEDVRKSNLKYREYLRRVQAQRAWAELQEKKLLESLDQALDDLMSG